MVTRKIAVQGMADQQDADKVSQALHEVWGTRKVEVSLDKGEATFTYDEKAASFEDFQQAILDSGFEIKMEDGEIEEEKIKMGRE
ncbi:heavy-metal-associated domain-containing protein [Paenactinomyces guangxiensis]|uniref:Heavy-metal-associated domain-containing protein n=1 Tax=Paenactinomyces guangxiensis TaxID=1490290 RepID=A0A7W2A7P6_9BACL|nr:heavy-metal-associated domain-containing protein [Paenactinomyces guangxiensis]MBA4494776.1 heavy-metal-associated domain-containing protein [Paenactinomyces guangxiensis]MBH8591860.1 heavy-metal-associated domain-containing protein [Paenactinomyces guangxiensis]